MSRATTWRGCPGLASLVRAARLERGASPTCCPWCLTSPREPGIGINVRTIVLSRPQKAPDMAARPAGALRHPGPGSGDPTRANPSFWTPATNTPFTTTSPTTSGHHTSPYSTRGSDPSYPWVWASSQVARQKGDNHRDGAGSGGPVVIPNGSEPCR